MVGVSFTEATVSTNVSVVVADPSLTPMLIVLEPNWFVAGVIVTVRLAPLPPNTMLWVGMSVGFDEPAVKVRLPAAVSTSPIVKLMAPVEVSSLIVRSVVWEMVGRSFTEVTVRTKVSLAVEEPSLTVTVMVAEPNWLVAGAIVIVRAEPAPPIAILPFGTSVGLEDEALTCKLAAAVSRSPMVNPIGPTAVSSTVDWFGISEMVGEVFVAFTVTTNVSLALVIPSLTLIVIV